MGKALLNTVSYQRLFPKLAMTMILATITGVLAGLLAGGLFYTAYLLLVRHGLDPDAALLVTGVGIAMAVAIFAALTAAYVRKLRQALQPLSPVASGVSDIINAFLEGWRSSPASSR